jgi:hypothetical protein
MRGTAAGLWRSIARGFSRRPAPQLQVPSVARPRNQFLSRQDGPWDKLVTNAQADSVFATWPINFRLLMRVEVVGLCCSSSPPVPF